MRSIQKDLQSGNTDSDCSIAQGGNMLGWILNPFGVDLGAYVVLWIGLLVIVIGSFVVALFKLIFGRSS